MGTTRSLVLEAKTDEVRVGDTVTFRVRDRMQNPVEGATVISRRKKAQTDETGRCQLTFRSPGFWTITAIKSSEGEVRYRPGTALVRAITRPAAFQRVQRIATYSE